MIFSGVKKIRIPEGIVKQIACGAVVLWEANSEPFIYTGNYTESAVTINSKAYTLYTLTTSGMLTLGGDALFWMNGGGAGGAKNNTKAAGASGHGGGGGYVLSGELSRGRYAVVIGAGGAPDTNGSATSIGDALVVSGGNADGSGGSGGGGTIDAYNAKDIEGGKGAGVSTYPFGLTDLKAHSPGGGGGEIYCSVYYKGADGGTNGGDGEAGNDYYANSNATIYKGGAGGEYGGGAGGSVGNFGSTTAGSNGAYYGAGAGGAALKDPKLTEAGTGYQGVVYIAIPTA